MSTSNLGLQLQTPKANLDSTINNQYYATQKQQQTHFVANQGPHLENHWYESRTPIGAGKTPGPLGNPHLVRAAPEPETKSTTNQFRESQKYMKGLYEAKVGLGRGQVAMYGG